MPDDTTSHRSAKASHDVTGPLFIDEVQGHERRYKHVLTLTHSSTLAAGVMLVATIVALVVVNTQAAAPFEHFLHSQVGLVFGDATLTMSVSHLVNDLLMALFFLLIGLEVKYEMTVGELTNVRQALLPVIASVGGAVVPVAVYLLFNASSPATVGGWGVPMATDTAFALGILAMLGNRIPGGVRVFLSTLAVADDIIAILVIAIFYTETVNLWSLVLAAVTLTALIALNRAHVYALLPYLVLGCALWACVYLSGLHATLAGMLLAFTIPSGSRVNLHTFIGWSDKKISQADGAYHPDEPLTSQKEYLRNVRNLSAISRQVIPPATRLENKLFPWVCFFVLPLFALTNANVAIAGDVGAIVAAPEFLGVFFGLLLGKPCGILLASLLVVKTGLASLPEHVSWRHMVGVSVLGSVGFTMAIFVSTLAFADGAAVVTTKLAILAASLVAGAAGFLLLALEARSTSHEEDPLPQHRRRRGQRPACRARGARQCASCVSRRDG